MAFIKAIFNPNYYPLSLDTACHFQTSAKLVPHAFVRVQSNTVGHSITPSIAVCNESELKPSWKWLLQVKLTNFQHCHVQYTHTHKNTDSEGEPDSRFEGIVLRGMKLKMMQKKHNVWTTEVCIPPYEGEKKKAANLGKLMIIRAIFQKAKSGNSQANVHACLWMP